MPEKSPLPSRYFQKPDLTLEGSQSDSNPAHTQETQCSVLALMPYAFLIINSFCILKYRQPGPKHHSATRKVLQQAQIHMQHHRRGKREASIRRSSWQNRKLLQNNRYPAFA